MQSLLVSMMRFSAAVSLFSMEQLQSTMSFVDGSEDWTKTMDRFEGALNSVTETLVSKIDDKKKETLKSVSKMSDDVVGRTMDSMIMVDPREMLRATTDIMQKTTDATADWVSKAASVVEKATDAVRSSDSPK